MQLHLNSTGRTRVLMTGLWVIGAIFIVRLFWLQVVQHDYYEARALQSQVTKFTIPAERGLIYAKDGDQLAPLVMNEPVYIAYADPHEMQEPEKVEALMRRVAGGNLLSGFNDTFDDKNSRYVVMAKGLNRRQAELIKKEALAGVGLQESTQRVYPEGGLAAQILGFVNGEGEGQYGIEGELDSRLKGTPGVLKAVTDVRQIPLTIGRNDVRIPAKNGDDLVLNIDRSVQAYAEKVLKDGLDKAKAKHGSILVMDPNTGAVMAMANYPTYDPARFGEVKEAEAFTNKVVSEPYEAGSVIKTLTMATGLDTKVITPQSSYMNTGSVTVDGVTIKNALQGLNGPTTMTQVLQYSLNTGVVHVMKQLGGGSINQKSRETFYRYLTERFGFGDFTGIEQQGESAGRIISPKEQEGNAVRYSNMSFGQGMDVTMIQTAAAFSAAINGGTYYKPQLVAGVRQDDGSVKAQAPQVVRRGVVSKETSDTLRNMVITARADGLHNIGDTPGYRIGGKTGSSQIIDPKTGKYLDNNSIGTYLGFGGDETPRYVIMVRIQDSQLGGFAGTEAASPVFINMSNFMLEHLNVHPVQ